MAVFGWAVLCAIMMYLSITCVLVLFNYGGEQTIGGAPNSLTARLVAWLFAVVVTLGWYEVFSMAPFEIVVK